MVWYGVSGGEAMGVVALPRLKEFRLFRIPFFGDSVFATLVSVVSFLEKQDYRNFKIY